MPIAPGQQLQHYRLIEMIGQGGMGVVWRALDTTLDREVAIKILPGSVATDREHLARFAREARLLASLNHPNIVTLFAVDHAEDVHFLVMEYVPGQTLDLLIPPGGLPRDRFFEVALPLLEAVAAAHERGITHRDLKPANVILGTDARVRVLDFGLAKVEAVGSKDSAATVSMGTTSAGTVVGTWAYMSPEQAEGLALDPRSDVFSLGVVLYEMATGRPPFAGDSPAQLISALLRDTPPAVSSIRTGLPQEVDAAIAGCLEKRRELRSTTARALLDDLRRVRERPAAGGQATTGEDRTIAVLPFANLSPDPADEYFSDGVTEEIINALARVPRLRVAARTSAFAFKGRAVDIGDIARQLNVATVLEGSVRRAGNRLRITARLVDVASGGPVWAERFDREMSDVFAVQDEIATVIASRFAGDTSKPPAGPLVTVGTRDLEAYEHFLQGRFFLNRRTEANLEKGIACFERALERDASFAEAWGGLADARLVLPWYSLRPTHEQHPRSLDAARRALRLDPRLGSAHATLGYLHMVFDWAWLDADREFREAIALSPGDVMAHKWYADLLMMTARPDEAYREVRKALELDPISANVLTIMGEWYRVVDRPEESLARYLRALTFDPNLPLALELAARHYWEFGDVEQYFSLRERLETVSARATPPTAELRQVYAAGGREAALRAQLAVAAADRMPTDRAIWHAELGEMDAAFADLEQAMTDRDIRLPYLTYFGDFGRIRRDPRYETVLKRMGLR